jgi:hypothetical protein
MLAIANTPEGMSGAIAARKVSERGDIVDFHS